MTGHIAHHSAEVADLSADCARLAAQPHRSPGPGAALQGARFRGIETELGKAEYEITEFPV